MDDAQLLAFFGVKPADLPPAQAAPTCGEKLARITPAADPQPCAVCGAPAWVTRTVATDTGRRWLDLCRPHRLTVSVWRRKHLPEVPLGDTVAALEEAAGSVGLRVRVIASTLDT